MPAIWHRRVSGMVAAVGLWIVKEEFHHSLAAFFDEISGGTTQLKVSPRGRPSRTLQVRSRMRFCMLARLPGATMGADVRAKLFLQRLQQIAFGHSTFNNQQWQE